MIFCITEPSQYPDTPETECAYGADFFCEDCICTGGTMSPVTLKPFRGNRTKYIEHARQLRNMPKPIPVDISELVNKIIKDFK